jgi:hypothetical protein
MVPEGDKQMRQPTKHQPTLVGKFITVDAEDHETFRVGEIVAKVDEHYFVRFETPDDAMRLVELWSIEQLAGACPSCGDHRVRFHESLEAVKEYVVWISKPDDHELRVVTDLTSKKPH